ncbi:MAG: AI-2E family transporter [Candidatus Paceibacterota bacterium]|jgi:predicted PurR-regulated permease PerM
MMQTKIIERYFFFGLLLTTFIFTFFIFRPFWIVLVLGLSFSIVLYPIYEWLKKIKIPDWLASLFTVTFFTVVVCGPLLGIGALVFNQSQDVYHTVTDSGSAKPFLKSIENKINKILPGSVQFDINKKTTELVSYLSNNIESIFTTTVSAFFSFALILLIIFYFLKDGAQWRKAIIVLSPLGDKDDEKIITRLAQAVTGVIKGSLLIALIQGILMGFGFWLFGIQNAALWGVVAAITSLVPTLGTSLVSIPAILFLFLTGDTTSAIGLLIWSVIMVGMIDNFLGPIIVGKKMKISSLLILFSVLGGISLLGPVGILVGPLTVSLLYTLISIYRNEFKQNTTL